MTSIISGLLVVNNQADDDILGSAEGKQATCNAVHVTYNFVSGGAVHFLLAASMNPDPQPGMPRNHNTLVNLDHCLTVRLLVSGSRTGSTELLGLCSAVVGDE
jgi:hypothetical protein